MTPLDLFLYTLAVCFGVPLGLALALVVMYALLAAGAVVFVAVVDRL